MKLHILKFSEFKCEPLHMFKWYDLTVDIRTLQLFKIWNSVVEKEENLIYIYILKKDLCIPTCKLIIKTVYILGHSSKIILTKKNYIGNQ